MTPAHPLPTVYVVDDDPAMRDSLAFMFTGTGLAVQTYASAEAFLEALPADARGCLILDLRMPGMSGHELHRHLNALGRHPPVIVLTGHGDVPTAVSEMKLGAIDFLTKPVNREVLLQRVRDAMDADQSLRRQLGEMEDTHRRLATLSPRELEVMDHVARGQANKEIARQLGVAERTVANHRAHLSHKLGAGNAADLVRKLGLIGRLGPHRDEALPRHG
jgi:FixJ family two-component response regulator